LPVIPGGVVPGILSVAFIREMSRPGFPMIGIEIVLGVQGLVFGDYRTGLVIERLGDGRTRTGYMKRPPQRLDLPFGREPVGVVAILMAAQRSLVAVPFSFQGA
jgi:hypothetical protein